MLIYYQDNHCKVTGSTCQRGQMPECPTLQNGIEIPCHYFLHEVRDGNQVSKTVLHPELYGR